MVTRKQVRALRDSIPPRQPRGSPANLHRYAAGAKFTAAVIAYGLQYCKVKTHDKA